MENKLYVARDKTGFLYLFNALPKKGENVYTSEEDDWILIPKELFPSLKFEDGPICVTLTEIGDAE